ncbi:MAG: glutathione S-transferase family protein [Sedimentitalea sp.]
MLTLFHSPGSCSDGILFLLEELEADFQVSIVDLRSAMQKEPAFLALNPKGKVPALRRQDGQVISEFQSIAFWLARTQAGGRLWPDDIDLQTRTLEALDFIIASVHMRGFTFYRVPQKFQLDEAGTQDLRAYGKGEFESGLLHLSRMLGDKEYLLGAFGLADAAAFYILQWAEKGQFELPDNLIALAARLNARPAAQRVLSPA